MNVTLGIKNYVDLYQISILFRFKAFSNHDMHENTKLIQEICAILVFSSSFFATDWEETAKVAHFVQLQRSEKLERLATNSTKRTRICVSLRMHLVKCQNIAYFPGTCTTISYMVFKDTDTYLNLVQLFLQ